MRIALVNPHWNFSHSIYFGCRAPHLPLELGYTRTLLQQAGHEVQLYDGLIEASDNDVLAEEVATFGPDMTVVTTAPTYLFWRCAPPELAVPRAFLDALRGRGGITVAVGPHGSTTPAATLHKLGVDWVVQGECEEVVARLAEGPRDLPGTARLDDGRLVRTGGPQAAGFVDAPALYWPDSWIARHDHHHHRFDTAPRGPGAEVEASRGCPYHCSFCAKIDFRDRYRRRAMPALLAEIDALRAQGVTYLYFIDEIFLPDRRLLEALLPRNIAFGVQTRLDLWKPEMIDLLGQAGCVSIEAGVESLTEAGRAALDKDCRMGTEELTERLLHARRRVPFVQANLIATEDDDAAVIAEWRNRLRAQGVWANDPVPLYPYPGSPDYRARWGMPDDQAWERAHQHYLAQFARLSDIQDDTPLPLPLLEAACR
jgi:B12-binding domain/radical SAM domain protein of rhizo-twelve system